MKKRKNNNNNNQLSKDKNGTNIAFTAIHLLSGFIESKILQSYTIQKENITVKEVLSTSQLQKTDNNISFQREKNNMEEPRVVFIEIPSMHKGRSGSLSPISPSPCRGKATGFFDLLSRRFGRRSHDELFYHHNHNGEEDTRSSSMESCSSTSGQLAAPSNNDTKHSHNELNGTHKRRCHSRNCSCEFDHGSQSNSSSDSNSDSVGPNDKNDMHSHRHDRSSSGLRRAMQNISISSRSLSCSGTPCRVPKPKKTKKTPPPPKCILRQPISYTYLKGMSGLPTQRVPRSSVCCQYTHR